MTQDRVRELWSAISPISYYDRIASAKAGGPDKKVLLVYANYDLTFPLRVFAAGGGGIQARGSQL